MSLLHGWASTRPLSLGEVVEAIDGTGGWGASEWVALFAALTSAVFAFLLWRVTSRYTSETATIAAANRKMAEANDRMVDANQLLLEEMRADRALARRRTSERAASLMSVALARAQRRWRDRSYVAGPPESVGRRRSLHWWETTNDFMEEVAAHAAAILDPQLRDDVLAFGKIHNRAFDEWDRLEVLLSMADTLDEAESQRPEEMLRHRLDRAATLLRGALGAHQRGDDLGERVLPDRTSEWWDLAPDDWERRWVG
jgi:hypothetical protein